MPNRIIKESIRTSDSINELNWFEEVLFYRLMVSCDDYGRFDGRIAIIKGTCFPLKDMRNGDIEKALHRLSALGMVTLYEVDGKPFLQLTAWERHQTIRAKKSKYPSVDEGNMITYESNCKQMKTDVPVIQSESKSKSESKSYTGDARLDEAIAEFVKHRKNLKKPMTDRAIQLMIGKLEELGKTVDERIAIINQSIENGWQGVFPLKEKEQTKKPQSKNRFNNFHQRDYDFGALERQLQEKQIEELTKLGTE
nr:MAG TPA: replisome organizer [Caudoviricetes sp.]